MTEKKRVQEKRRFIRHPICLPLKIRKERAAKDLLSSETLNVSMGGLLFLSSTEVAVDAVISVTLPFKDKIFKIRGKVVRCEKDLDSRLYNIGIEFLKISDAFKVRLVEQLHLIEEYRCLRSIQLNRDVNLPEASREWIKRYSEQFKKLYW